MNILVEYDGEYPNLCGGTLVVVIDGKRWPVSVNSWCVYEWPKGFPEEVKVAVLDVLDDYNEDGCCGGCNAMMWTTALKDCNWR